MLHRFEKVAAADLQPGDSYIWRTPDGLESREVVSVIRRVPYGGSLLWTRYPDGNVSMSYIHGMVDAWRAVRVEV
jgi:hypothetical protein